MANYGPKDTQLVLVVGAQLEDAQYHIKHVLPRSSEIIYQARSIMVPRRLEGLRFNRVIFTPRAQDMLRKASVIQHSEMTLRNCQAMTHHSSMIEWPDGL